ncbi:hypothetical protein [Nafulsella turpanensis]|uniref:hypothetical protein n=1 Tax=Nafulsella turpanensis TaxID=1265690 RepID=UPI0003478F6B|nr:hypothetical protein [Nafulsella turpanensis]
MPKVYGIENRRRKQESKVWMKKETVKQFMEYFLGGLIVLALVIPNTTNFKERNAFSDEKRLEEAMELYRAETLGDSVTLVPGEYYDRGKFFTFFLGEKNRGMWTTPVTAAVFDYEKAKGGLEPVGVGGSNQTISIDLADSAGREWELRSMNKDQKNALPKLLRPTFLRFMFRDQVAAMNPYASLVVPVLSEAIDIHHVEPKLYFVPYNEEYGKYNERMAGRLAYLEADLDSSWEGSEEFGEPEEVVEFDEMMEIRKKDEVPIDEQLYLKSRLFDMLISDWDRHEGQWEWALVEKGGEEIFEPIPVDRDNAFYTFNEGALSHLALLLNKKFQSFRKDYGKVSGLMKQSAKQDVMILADVPLADFVETAREIQEELTDEVIHKAFKQYPEPVYEMKGKEHEEILKVRLEKLPEAAAEFFHLIQKKNRKNS